MGGVEPFAVRVARAEELGSRCNGHPEEVDGALPELVAMLAGETDEAVLGTIVEALGQMWDPRCADYLIALSAHPAPAIQAAVARALGGALCNNERMDGIEVLITLSAAADPDTRDWATFNLALRDADSPEIRAALWARINDTDCNADGEALCGLAKRRDPSVGARIAEQLSVDAPGNLIVEAAGELADPALLPALHALSESDWREFDQRPEILDWAIDRCAGVEPTDA
jgi:HEAT repeat protein